MLTWILSFAHVTAFAAEGPVQSPDRYAQALLYRDLARSCFESAKAGLGNP